MAKTEKNLLVISFVLFAILNIVISEMCDPKKDYTSIVIGERIYYSQHVIVGTVQDIIEPDPKYPNEEKAYGAKFMVKCIYKGGSIPKDITIVGAGMVSGKCHSTNITKGGVYIMYLNKDDSQEKWFEPAFLENDGGEQFIDEITFECNMKPIPPIGEEGTVTDCPASEDAPDSCDTWTPAPTTEAPTPTPEPETEAPKKTEKPETPGKGSQSVDDNGSPGSSFVSFMSLFICLISSVLL